MAGKLKPLDVERETRPGKYPDGDGLYLVVASPTSKNWSYRYWKDAKQRWLGPGSPKDVSLKDARLAGAMQRVFASKAIAAHPASTSCRRSERPRGCESRRDQDHSAHLRGMCRNLHSRALDDLEQEASQSMAVVVQTRSPMARNFRTQPASLAFENC
jgi:hypothetical protein